MDNAKAIEAAARAIENGSAEEWEALPLLHKQVFRSQAKAAVKAYLAAMEAEGYAFINTRQIAVTSGPPIYNPAARPQIGG